MTCDDNKQNISPIFPLYTLYIWCHNMKHRHCYWPINIKLSDQAGARETIINRSINYYQCLDQHSLVCSALRDSSNSTDPVAWDRAYLILLSAPGTTPPPNNNPPAQPSVVVGPLSLSLLMLVVVLRATTPTRATNVRRTTHIYVHVRKESIHL